MRILIVEDEIKIRRGMANLISNHTEHVVVGEAKNGQEGLEMALQFQPDLVITDIRMPVVGGLEMIKAMREKGLSVHCVILSGYSEFDYAKQAIKYGVDDYLIKPLAPEDITGLLDSVEKKISKELMQQQVTPERRLRDYILEEEEPLSEEELLLLCGFPAEGAYRMIGVYLGSSGQDGQNACLDRFHRLQESWVPQKFYCIFVEKTRELIVVAEDRNWDSVRQEIEQRLLQNSLYRYDWVWGEEWAGSLPGLKRAYQKLQQIYPYGMILGHGRIIDWTSLEGLKIREYVYPNAIELQMSNAVYSGKKELVEAAALAFAEETAGQMGRPDQKKEGYMRLLNALLELSKESNRKLYEQLLNLNLMKRIGLAVTGEELQSALSEAVRIVTVGMDAREDISNYTIKRAIDYIRNHYQEGISLEAVAASLDITPEYLSTLFNREMGINFSVFLKKFRISHAKRLLKGTDRKIYEVAQEVGYLDAKYFNRVFKEEEGLSPGDFRNLNR